MNFLDQVAVLILTKNEEPNIARTLRALSRFPEIVVLDSGSDDATCEIVAATPNARLMSRAFDAHAAQWNYGLTLLPTKRPWVLALDADYLLSERLVDEIALLAPDADIVGYRTSFRYCIYGKPLSGSLYPPVIVLFRHARGSYEQHGHTQRLKLDGAVVPLSAQIHHDDRKPLSRWFGAQIRYAALEADHILMTPSKELRRIDRLRKLGWVAPLLVLPHALLVKRCFFGGWRGWFYALQRLAAEVMIGLTVLDLRLNPTTQEKWAAGVRTRHGAEE